MDVINFTRLNSLLPSLKQQFNSAKPFRYLVIDDFLSQSQADKILEEFPSVDPSWVDARGHHTNNKWTQPCVSLSHGEKFYDEVSSMKFRDWLSELTSIDKIESDPNLSGAGYHQTLDDGYLNVHIDFNKLEDEGRTLNRRLNLLVYLNKGWKKEYGGQLELWDMENKVIVQNIHPSFNRAVLFETNSISYHGHPRPVKTGGTSTRKSLSIYYYTDSRIDKVPETQFQNTQYKNMEGISGFIKNFKNGCKHFARRCL